ncbi:ATP-dependent DNA helicase RecQ [uncultured Candidatus Thioglobus sp.]|nr:ATP-dependent DNA helicase RecQ [uncultured Candidatus Thioglobus sp.]
MEMLYPLLIDVCNNGTCSERCIIFCRTYDDTLYLFKLAVLFLNGRNALYISKERVCDKYDASTAPDIKERVVQSFTQGNGSLRLVIATVAFAMGLDSPNVRHVIHWGPPDDIEMYVQEAGRAGRDGLSARAVLYYNRNDISNAVTCHTSPGMKAYCKNTDQCRRSFLMSIFAEYKDVKLPTYRHNCCDICASMCSCSQCNCAIVSVNELDEPCLAVSQLATSPTEQLDRAKQAALTDSLVQLRTELCSTVSDDYLLVGAEICTGLSKSVIKKIVSSVHQIRTEEDLLMLGITSRLYCSPVLDLIHDSRWNPC